MGVNGRSYSPYKFKILLSIFDNLMMGFTEEYFVQSIVFLYDDLQVLIKWPKHLFSCFAEFKKWKF